MNPNEGGTGMGGSGAFGGRPNVGAGSGGFVGVGGTGGKGGSSGFSGFAGSSGSTGMGGTGGSGGSAGSGGTAGSSGFAGKGGAGGTGGRALTVDEACTAQCLETVQPPACALPAQDCEDICVYIDDSYASGACSSEYVAYLRCVAPFTQSQWLCEEYFPDLSIPVPARPSACDAATCAWVCCDPVAGTPEQLDACGCV